MFRTSARRARPDATVQAKASSIKTHPLSWVLPASQVVKKKNDTTWVSLVIDVDVVILSKNGENWRWLVTS
jgi:hypothetical protein